MKPLILLTVVLFTVFQSFAQLTPVAYEDGNQKLNGIAAIPGRPNNLKSGILILPAWKGIDNHSKETAAKLSAIGYYAFIADIYGADNYPLDNTSAAKQSGYYKKEVAAYQKRISLALQQLTKLGADPNNIVIIGYCFGGTGALEAARGELPVKGVVSFHGGLAKVGDRESKPLAAKVLVLHGADDPHVSPAEIKGFQDEMRATKADWQMVYYADAVHAFSDPYAGSDPSKGAAFNEKAAKRSWDHMLLFLRDLLR